MGIGGGLELANCALVFGEAGFLSCVAIPWPQKGQIGNPEYAWETRCKSGVFHTANNTLNWALVWEID